MHQLVNSCIVYLVVTNIGPVDMNAGTTYVTTDTTCVQLERGTTMMSMQLLQQSWTQEVEQRVQMTFNFTMCIERHLSPMSLCWACALKSCNLL